MSRFAPWKYVLLIVVTLFGIIYAIPNWYGDDPAVQISTGSPAAVAQLPSQVQSLLAGTPYTVKAYDTQPDGLLVRFTSTNNQLSAQTLLAEKLGSDYSVALNLAPTTPTWLSAIGANPMSLGLDLRGGIHFLIAIDVNALINRRIGGDARGISDELRTKGIRYSSINVTPDNHIILGFRDLQTASQASSMITNQFPELLVTSNNKTNPLQLDFTMTPQAVIDAQNYAVEQTITILRNRINQLGIAEPIVQRQGADRISVDLPGIQDTARARQILGGTATLEFRLVDIANDPTAAVVPADDKRYQSDTGPVLLQNRVILSGTSITGAVASTGDDGRPSVNIRLGGGGEALFYQITGQNVGKPLAIVYVESKMTPVQQNGKTVYTTQKSERIISIANIQSALPSQFQITGLSSANEANDLALLLRAGALPAPMSIIEESTIGPSLGAANIHKGVLSVEIGFLLIVVFMALYYRVMGLLADVTLLLNLILIVAVLSVLGATLTLPAIAAMVLNVGMAVDANVLIFERIREELRNGMSPQASIQAGFERAFATIVDSNVTTLIAAIALFGIGTGAVKGFAVTLTIGILISMFTAITATRALIYLCYGGRKKVTRLSIGIKSQVQKKAL